MQGTPEHADHEADLAVFYDREAAVGSTRAMTNDEEVLNPDDREEPRRFFSRRSDDALRLIFSRHGHVEHFETWAEGTGAESGPGAGGWTQHYQFLVLRTPNPK
jgi:hypothetical protein